MTLVVDASVVLRWFVDQQPGVEAAAGWLRRFVADPRLLVAPDLLRFELFGAIVRLAQGREVEWAQRRLDAFHRLRLRLLPTTEVVLRRATQLACEMRIGGYDSIYLAHADSLGSAWLTADERALRRLAGSPLVRALEPASPQP